MPNWTEILQELSSSNRVDALDFTRGKYLKLLHEYTDRNVIAYYSGWLEGFKSNKFSVSDADMNAFMNCINKLDRSKGLDLILHTPGGNVTATEAIVKYLKAMFGNDIRVIVPQLAMSAGTMIACSSKVILMGKQSNLGPIDPQFGNMPAQGVLDEIDRIKKEIATDKNTIPLWHSILQKYHPTFIGECELAVKLSHEMVSTWLKENMLADKNEAEIAIIVTALSDHGDTMTHSRHLDSEKCKSIGLKIEMLEDDQDLQDLVLSVHHAFIHTFSNPKNVAKIVENHNNDRMVFFEAIH